MPLPPGRMPPPGGPGLAMGFTGIAGTMARRAAPRRPARHGAGLDPDAARERAERARRQARIEIWPENSGNSGLAGRELPSAEVIETDARITAVADVLRPPPPRQVAGTRLASSPARTWLPDLDDAPRPHLHSPARSIPGVTLA
jgi:hypothetical protein